MGSSLVKNCPTWSALSWEVSAASGEVGRQWGALKKGHDMVGEGDFGAASESPWVNRVMCWADIPSYLPTTAFRVFPVSRTNLSLGIP